MTCLLRDSTSAADAGKFFPHMERTFIAITAAFCLAGLTACNTMRGMGEDISAFGRYISNSSGTSSSHSSPPSTGY
jgi:predicted small secreted protein